jgi:flagellar hook-associated protein 1 FlgK
MSVSDIFEIGRQGLAANRQALQTTSNNIANANTPGYTRQRAVMEERQQQISEGLVMGGGVDVTRVLRVHDKFVDRQLVDESKFLGTYKTRSEGLKHIEALVTNGGGQLSTLVSNFFNAYRELSSNPEQPALRSQVAETAKASADGFRRMSDSLDNVKRDLDLKIEALTQEINADTKEFAALNQKITAYIAGNQEPNELLDRRDNIVKKLSRTCGFDISEDEAGRLNFGMTGMGALIQGDTANELVTARTPAHGDKDDGNMDIYVKGPFGNVVNVTPSFREGELAGLLQVRDKFANSANKWLDSVAFQFGNAVNEIHRAGVGVDGVGERDLFVLNPESKQGAARDIRVNDALESSFESIAAGFSGDAPGDNRIALAIANLQNSPLMPVDGQLPEGAEARYTLGESLNALVGNIGTQAAHESQLFDHQDSIVGQLENYRASISGVSLEEEAANMMQQQAVFNASAKAMKVGDELLQTILSIKP